MKGNPYKITIFEALNMSTDNRLKINNYTLCKQMANDKVLQRLLLWSNTNESQLDDSCDFGEEETVNQEEKNCRHHRRQ